jgi:twitching motility protein PilT
MIELFPAAKQQQVRSIMAGVLKGVVSQRLLPAARGGRVPAVEVMVVNARIADLIRENRADEVEDAIAAGEFYEMQTFQQHLIDLTLTGRVEEEIAANAATNRHDFLVALDAAKKEKVADEKAAAEAEASKNGSGSGIQPLGSSLR